jgi:hypothetical protein
LDICVLFILVSSSVFCNSVAHTQKLSSISIAAPKQKFKLPLPREKAQFANLPYCVCQRNATELSRTKQRLCLTEGHCGKQKPIAKDGLL